MDKGEIDKFTYTILLILLFGFSVQAVTNYLNVGGKLKDSEGNLLTGTHNITFRVYNVSSGGGVLWEENHTDSNAVSLSSEGYFTVSLGQYNTLDLLFDENYWVELVIDGETLTPRHRIGSSGYSFRSETAKAIECPDGMADAGNFCIDVSLTSTTSDWWDHTINSCAPEGKRICFVDEWWLAINTVDEVNGSLCPSKLTLNPGTTYTLTSTTTASPYCVKASESINSKTIPAQTVCCLGG